VNVSRLREVDITDLLRRETTHLDNEYGRVEPHPADCFDHRGGRLDWA
jgi:hypothetical protein